jgi:predicted nucleic acid-binding protein
VIYLDSSVVLSQLLAENRLLPKAITEDSLVSSRLLEYEIWNRIHARGLTRSHADEVHAFLERVLLIDLTASVLARALKPFPVSVRTLDGLHLATIEHLRVGGDYIELASFDRRLVAGAQALGVAIFAL